ncbi:MAG: DUF1232 domain-containing protein [Calditrichota bacterium]
MKENPYFNRALDTADSIIKEQEKVKLILNNALEKAREKKSQVREFFGDIEDLIMLIRSYLKGEYTRIPWRFIILAFAAVIYFLNPLDLIPDIIPAMGFMDDATVIAIIVNAMKEEIDEYRRFRSMQNVVGS